ncbi:hypothetical protein ACVOMS_24035 [Bradyrhizobium guangxiense]
MAAKASEHGDVGCLRCAIEIKPHQRAQAAYAVTLGRLREHGLRVEAGDEGLAANVVRYEAGRDPDRVARPVDEAECDGCQQRQRNERGQDAKAKFHGSSS